MTEMFGEAWSPMSVPDLAPDDDDDDDNLLCLIYSFMIYVSTTLSVAPYYLHGITITVTLITFECNVILHIPVEQSMFTGYLITICIIVMICRDHLALSSSKVVLIC